MQIETASIHVGEMIKTLLHVHALTNMHRSSDNKDYRTSAAAWLPQLRRQLEVLEHELTKEVSNADHG